MSQKIKKFFKAIANIFKIKEKEVPENQDALGAYPLRMQISAIPERRYLRTARLLAVITFLNIAVLIALSGFFIYYATQQDVRISGQRIYLYALDPEYKIIQSMERDRSGHRFDEFVMEQAIRDYIKSRFTFFTDYKKQAQSRRYVQLYMHGDKLKKFMNEEVYAIDEQARRKGVNREVHIYSLRQTPMGLWEALIDVFDMKPRDPYNPICDCDDNSRECLKCKEELNLGRERYRIYIRSGFHGIPNIDNPFGVRVEDVHITPQIVHPNDKFWNIPPILKPEI
ncbi:MAG: hypothetical protein SPL08_01585 [Pseudomonadota bacterium]|nr:hypothetical protein [Pseudomonadota bacterium]